MVGYNSLLTLSHAKAESLMNDLPIAEQASVVLMAPWERRQETILLSRNAKELVQGLPVQELFWTVKATGPQDAVHLLSLANTEQLQFMFDLDWWHKDGLRPEKIATWILLLFEAGENVVGSWLQWLITKDKMLLPAILGPFILVYKRPDDMDIQEAKDVFPPFTLDDVYFLSFKKEALQPIWSRILMKMLEISPGLYRDVLETMLWEANTETLEDAYRRRCFRLGDWGLPDYYDSLDIYAPLSGSIRRIDILPSHEGEWQDALLPAFVPTLYIEEYPVLRSAIEGLSGTTAMERVICEWTGAANKVLMADNVDFDDPDALRNALVKVAAFLNLGLESAIRSENGSPREIMRSCVIEDIIRLAHMMTRKLVARARDLMKSGWISEDLLHLPDAWANTLRGLLRDHPLLWDRDRREYCPFSELRELSTVEELITIIGEWACLMAHIPPPWRGWALDIPWTATNFGGPNEVVWSQALVTALAQRALGGELRVRPIPASKLPQLRRMWFLDGRTISSNWKKDGPPIETIMHCLKALEPVAGQAGLEPAKLDRIVKESLMSLYEEWAELPEDIMIDGRYVSSLIVDLTA